MSPGKTCQLTKGCSEPFSNVIHTPFFNNVVITMWVLFNNCKVCSTVLTQQEGSVSEWWLKLLTPRPGSQCSSGLHVRGRRNCGFIFDISEHDHSAMPRNLHYPHMGHANFTVNEKALVHLYCTAYPIIPLSLCPF